MTKYTVCNVLLNFFQRKSSLSSQWMVSHSTANQKAFAVWTEVKSLRERPNQKQRLLWVLENKYIKRISLLHPFHWYLNKKLYRNFTQKIPQFVVSSFTAGYYPCTVHSHLKTTTSMRQHKIHHNSQVIAHKTTCVTLSLSTVLMKSHWVITVCSFH